MKQKFTVFLLFALVSLQTVVAQNINEIFGKRTEIYFSFRIHSKNEIQSITRLISVDNVKNDTVWAYANIKEFIKFSKLGYNINFLPHPGDAPGVIMKDYIPMNSSSTWNYYPTYDAYVSLMNAFQAAYPNICQVQTIATLASSRKILVAKISNNVATDEAEPEFLYSSTMHGDEVVGYVLMLHLIDYLLSNYGTNSEVTDLVNTMEIYIAPLANPDGTYAGGNSTVTGATRYNANSVDLNRNYPDPQDGAHPDGNAYQAETTGFMDFATQHHFVAAANFHAGSEVVNYPWDTWATLTADDSWWQYVSREFADTAHIHAPAGYMTLENNGITDGYAWYEANGGRQDYMNNWQHCRECTIELSDTKMLPATQLLDYWSYDWRSFLLYMKEARYGIQGLITDQVTGLPVAAKVFISGHDINNSEVYSSANLGDYHRLLKGGTYTLTISATNYTTKTISGIVVTDHLATNLNIQLMPLTPSAITLPASSVTATSAVLNGTVNPNSLATTYHFDWGTTISYGNTTTTTSAGSGSATLSVNAAVTGLVQGTTYHYRISATNSNGTTTGNDLTLSYGMVLLTTTPASSITASAAASGGSITSDGGVTVTSRGVCWSTSASPTTANSHTTDGGGTGVFTSSMAGLTGNTIYHIRAYATNTTGTYYGDDQQFTTLVSLPAISTTTPSSVTTTTAASGGNVTATGSSSVTARGVCWSTVANPSITDSHTTDGSGAGVFTSSITGLTASTTYHVRAYATNASGTSYGSDLMFTTVCGSISTFPWNEGFENGGLIPNCWTQERVASSGIDWAFITGSGSSYPAAAHGGTYNACLKDVTSSDNKTKLITPSINLSLLSSPVLKFWHTQASWGGDQDQLIVYYRTSAAGTWTTLATYTSSITTWTLVTISIPYPSSDYYIAFEGNAKWGYGVCIDDVSITGNTIIPTLSITPSDRPVTAVAGNTTFAVTSNTAWAATSNQSWCTVTPSGTGNGTITANYLANTLVTSRVANITVQVTGLTPIVVTVTQAGVPPKTLNLSSVFLEGLYNGNSTMFQARDEAGPHWTDGSADHITVELHNSVTYSTIEYSASDILLSTTGTATVSVPGDRNGSYYVTVKHRNSIETTTASPVNFSGATISYAFDATAKAYGNNMTQMLEADGTTFSPPLIFSGDENQDGQVESGDLNDVGNMAAIFALGYLKEDLYADGQVESADLNIVGNNASTFVYAAVPR